MLKSKDIRSVAASKYTLVMLGCIALAGCQAPPKTQDELLASHDYRLKHPIVITEEPEVMDLPIGRSTRRLYGPVESSITAFAVDAQRRGSGAVEILVPSGGANEAAVHAVTDDIRRALRRGGLKRSKISTRTYTVTNASADAPIRLSYAALQATAGQCGSWPRNLAGGVGENVNYENYGCATQANLAAMVANPSDLITPRASTPGDQGRRATVIENYRKGDVTAGEFNEGVGAEIAE